MQEKPGVARVTVALDPVDVDLLDRLAALEGSNRSAELRSVLQQLRPMLETTVRAFEAAQSAREAFDRAAAEATATEMAALVPDIERMQSHYLGLMARLEGAAAAADPRPSNHGGHTPNPPDSPDEGSAGS